MFTKRTKQYLMLLAVIGLVAVAAGGSGTFAGFNAEVANTGNTFQTGTLFLHNTNGSTTCTSEADSSNANNLSTNGCAVLFDISPSTTPFTDGTTYNANLTLTNAGSLNAGAIKFDLNGNGCNDSKPSIGTLGAGLTNGNAVASITISNLTETIFAGTKIQLHENSDANTQTFTVTGTSYAPGASVVVNVASQNANFSYTTAATVSLDAFGTGLCTQLKLNVQEMTDNTFGTAVTNRCAYPSSVVATCGSTGTLLNDGAFASLQPLTLDNTGLGGNSGTDLTAKKSRYFQIHVIAPASMGNSAQNDQMTFDLRWHIDQA